jgi:vacuolar protein sorting-associated protein 41
MKKVAGSASAGDSNAPCSASASPPVASSSSQQNEAAYSRASTLRTGATRVTSSDACSHSSSHSHDTVEKARDRHEGNEEDESYSSYSSYYDSYEEDEGVEESEEGLRSSQGEARDGTGSPPPQEDLLRFLSFTLEDAALRDHRLMTMEAFRHVVLLGTNQGAVAVVEASTGRLKDLLFNHREPISDVDCNINELYVASSDKAGYVSVQSRRDTKDVWISQLGVPVESIALHPLYHKLDSCPMVCGGGTKVLLLTKGMLWSNSRRVTTLQECRGRIHRVRWCHRPSIDIVAWLSELEITLYDMKNEAVVRRVALPDGTLQNVLYPPTLRWERASTAAGGRGGDGVDEDGNGSHNQAVLLCGWGDVVQEIRVTSGLLSAPSSAAVGAPAANAGLLQLLPITTTLSAPFQLRSSAAITQSASSRASTSLLPAAATTPSAASSAAPTSGRAPYTIELRTLQPLRPSRTAFPYRVCGIAPYGPQRYVILASLVDPRTEGVMKDLEVRVVERNSLVDVYRGRMPVRFIHPLQLRLTYLDPIPSHIFAAAEGGGNGSCSSAFKPVLDPLSPSPLTQYFILSVDTIVKATPADIDDHVEFLLRTGQFEKAYTYASVHLRQLRRHVLPQVGHQWLLHLFEKRTTKPAAILKVIELLPELVPDYDGQAWEQWIYRLDTCGESWRLVALLPGRGCASKVYHLDNQDDAATGFAAASANAYSPARIAAAATLQASIKREYYDLVLLRCLRHDANLFYAALHKFDSLFTVSVVLKATEAAYRKHCTSQGWWSVEEGDGEEEMEGEDAKGGSRTVASPTSPSTKQAKREDAPSEACSGAAAAGGTMSRTARWSLAASYGYLLRCAGRFEEAMQILMHLPSSPRSDKELFGLISSEQLFSKTLQLLPELLQRREDATLQLLMEHVAPPSPPHGSVQHLVSEDAVASALPPPTSPKTTAQLLEASQYGSAEDPLNIEAVVDRLKSSDRLHLLHYLDLVKELYPKKFVETAKRHAQLLATLYIDYDRGSLLPFLKQMSMYVERIRELHALCHKNNYAEEEIFLLFRMGREEEALRILIEKMHDIHRALEFVVSIADRDEQAALFVRLVDFIVNYNASLPCRRKRRDDDENEDSDDDYDAAVVSGGIRYVLHQTQPGETYASIAQSYHVSADDLRKANRMSTPKSRPGSSCPSSPPMSAPKGNPRGVYALSDPRSSGSGGGFAGRSASPGPPPPARCIVPLNLFGSLLNALADPQFSEHPALDVRLVLKKLPGDEPIPHAGASIAAIAHTMAEETAFLSTVSQVGERDLMGYYAQLLKRRTAAIVMGQSASRAELPYANKAATSAAGSSGGAAASAAATLAVDGPPMTMAHRCAACHLPAMQHVVVFGCQHLYHPSCLLQYMKESKNEVAAAALTGHSGQAVGVGAAGVTGGCATTPAKAEETLRKLSAYCGVCRQHTGEQH